MARFTALNGGPEFTFDEAISFEIDCDDQAEVDHYWESPSAKAGSTARAAGSRTSTALSWQVVPRQLYDLVFGPDARRGKRPRCRR